MKSNSLQIILVWTIIFFSSALSASLVQYGITSKKPNVALLIKPDPPTKKMLTDDIPFDHGKDCGDSKQSLLFGPRQRLINFSRCCKLFLQNMSDDLLQRIEQKMKTAKYKLPVFVLEVHQNIKPDTASREDCKISNDWPPIRIETAFNLKKSTTNVVIVFCINVAMLDVTVYIGNDPIFFTRLCELIYESEMEPFNVTDEQTMKTLIQNIFKNTGKIITYDPKSKALLLNWFGCPRKLNWNISSVEQMRDFWNNFHNTYKLI